MTTDKLLVNLEKLRRILPGKPINYTPEYPKNIRDSLSMYIRQCTLGNIRTASWRYELSNWPLPLFMDPNNIRLGPLNEHIRLMFSRKPFFYYTLVGMFRKKEKSVLPRPTWYTRLIFSLIDKSWIDFYEYLNVATLTEYMNMSSVDDITMEIFEINYKYIKSYLYNHSILKDRGKILNDIFQCYENKNWAACINTMYPLLDLLIRDYCGSIRFDKDIKAINSSFKGAGFKDWDIDNLKHGALSTKMSILSITNKISPEEANKFIKENDNEKPLGLPGIAISSFLKFAGEYYAFVRKDEKQHHELNRHAIMHGSSVDYGTKINSVKLFAFLFLTLELEPVLRILFQED